MKHVRASQQNIPDIRKLVVDTPLSSYTLTKPFGRMFLNFATFLLLSLSVCQAATKLPTANTALTKEFFDGLNAEKEISERIFLDTPLETFFKAFPLSMDRTGLARTPLHMAVQSRNDEFINSILLVLNSDRELLVDLRDSRGWNAFDYALRYHPRRAIHLLNPEEYLQLTDISRVKEIIKSSMRVPVVPVAFFEEYLDFLRTSKCREVSDNPAVPPIVLSELLKRPDFDFLQCPVAVEYAFFTKCLDPINDADVIKSLIIVAVTQNRLRFFNLPKVRELISHSFRREKGGDALTIAADRGNAELFNILVESSLKNRETRHQAQDNELGTGIELRSSSSIVKKSSTILQYLKDLHDPKYLAIKSIIFHYFGRLLTEDLFSQAFVSEEFKFFHRVFDRGFFAASAEELLSEEYWRLIRSDDCTIAVMHFLACHKPEILTAEIVARNSQLRFKLPEFVVSPHCESSNWTISQALERFNSTLSREEKIALAQWAARNRKDFISYKCLLENQVGEVALEIQDIESILQVMISTNDFNNSQKLLEALTDESRNNLVPSVSLIFNLLDRGTFEDDVVNNQRQDLMYMLLERDLPNLARGPYAPEFHNSRGESLQKALLDQAEVPAIIFRFWAMEGYDVGNWAQETITTLPGNLFLVEYIIQTLPMELVCFLLPDYLAKANSVVSSNALQSFRSGESTVAEDFKDSYKHVLKLLEDCIADISVSK